MEDKVNLLKNRVTLRNLVARHIDEGSTYRVLCIFNSTSKEYRFTFVAKITLIGETGTFITTETAPRRFTYILGPGEIRRTAAQRFLELSQNREQAGLKDHGNLFVERLKKEFFRKYKEHYQKFVDYIIYRTDAPAKIFGIQDGTVTETYESACKPARDWVKRLLGRLIFIHFLQKKGWMGCPAGSKKWTNGDPNFLWSLFKNCTNKETFSLALLCHCFSKL